MAEDYIVRDGDTLAKIARQRLGNESRWQEIAQLNGLSMPYKLKTGQKLRLPDGAVASNLKDETEKVAPANAPAKSETGPTAVAVMGIALMIAAGIAHLFGTILFLAAAFRQSIWWFLGCLLIHPVWIFFLLIHWGQAKKGFLIQIAASLGLAIGYFIAFCGGLWLST